MNPIHISELIQRGAPHSSHFCLRRIASGHSALCDMAEAAKLGVDRNSERGAHYLWYHTPSETAARHMR
jgi:hypothetical protein